MRPRAAGLRRTRWALLAWACLVLTWIAGVPAAAAEPIRVWHAYRGAEEEVLTELLAQWDGPVDALALPYDSMANKLGAAIPLGEGPHLFIDSHERLGDYRRRQIVAPVGDALELPAYGDGPLAAVTADGERWGIPLALKCVALYQNTDLETEVPASMEALAASADALPDGVFALAYEARNPYAHAPFLHAFGGRMLTEDGQFGLVGPEAERSLQFVTELLQRGVVPAEADGALVNNLFRSGKAAHAISGPWLAADLGDSVPYRVLPLPRIEAAGGPMRPYVTVESIMLSPFGAQRDDVRALARHLSSVAASELRQQRARAIPARRDAALPADDPLLAAFAAQAAQGVVMPNLPQMRSTWEPARKALRKVLGGEAPAAEALDEARHRFDDVMRPPPPPRSPTLALLALGALTVWGALVLVRRVSGPAGRRAFADSLPAYRWVAHAVVAIGVLVLLPLAVGAATSLFAGPAGEVRYVGLANFVEILTARGRPLLSSGSFYLVLAVTVLWTAVNVVFHVGIGLALGLLLSRPLLRMKAVYRVLLIIPWAVPNYVTALAWKGMFHRQFGAITGFIHAINDTLGTSIEPISWFAKFSTAFAANCATNIWLGFPFMMVVTLGALTAVPKDVLEAAEVDGASRWQRLWHVVLPMVRPSLMPAITLGAIWTFNMFNVVFLVSGGDPDGTTDILVSEAYRWAFTREAQYGYAAAYAVLIFLMLLSTTKLLDRFKSSWARAGRGGEP